MEKKFMKTNIILLFLCMLTTCQVQAQEIIGKIVDAKGKPLAFANMVFLNRADSTFIKGTVSGEDGSFTIDSSCNGRIVKVSSVGYKTICIDCQKEDLGVIALMEDWAK